MLKELNQRSRDIFRQLVETYLETGAPVGSKTLADRLPLSLSPASVRNVMAALEESGLLYAPHTSAGRVPTEAGLRIFVDGLLEVGNLTEDERAGIESRCTAVGRSLEDVLAEVVTTLSGLCRCAGLVIAAKTDAPLRHMEFVNLGPGRVLVVIVSQDGSVENRVIAAPRGIPPAALIQAGNYLNAHIAGRTLAELREHVSVELSERQAELDERTAQVVEAGLASWSGEGRPNLIVRGRANLLEDLDNLENLEVIRQLFDDLENKKELLQLMDLAQAAEGVRIFIGSENKLFSLSGSSLIVAPYMNTGGKVIGALGVIGPTRVNYARVVPMVDFTARTIGHMISRTGFRAAG